MNVHAHGGKKIRNRYNNITGALGRLVLNTMPERIGGLLVTKVNLKSYYSLKKGTRFLPSHNQSHLPFQKSTPLATNLGANPGNLDVIRWTDLHS